MKKAALIAILGLGLYACDGKKESETPVPPAETGGQTTPATDGTDASHDAHDDSHDHGFEVIESASVEAVKLEPIPAAELQTLLPGQDFPAQITSPARGDAKPQTYTPEYRIAKKDLNGDGKEEIFVFYAGEGMCGMGGCELRLYGWDQDGKPKQLFAGETFGILTPGERINYMPQKSNGYQSVEVDSRFWMWDGTAYR